LFNLTGLKISLSRPPPYPVQGEKSSHTPSINITLRRALNQSILSVHAWQHGASSGTAKSSAGRTQIGSPRAPSGAGAKAGELHTAIGSPCPQPCLQNRVCKAARAVVFCSGYGHL